MSGIDAQAVWVTTPRTIELRPEVAPMPGPGEIRVQAIASAISQGTEMLVYRGQVPPDMALDLPTLQGSFALPIKYGYAMVGRVIDVGPDVERVAVGDAVFVLHPHQSVFTVPADLATPLPRDLDPALGVFMANVETALNIVHDSPLRLGETAVVYGLGTVGLLVVQLLRMAGAARLVAVDPLPHRRATAEQLGVDLALTPDDGLPGRVRELTAGRGADVAIEVSGAPAALQSAIDVLADEGTAVVASWYGAKPVALALGDRFHRGRLRLRSSQVGHLNPSLAPRWDYARRTATVVDFLQRLQLAPLITHRVPFAQAADAWRLVDEHPDEVVQVAIEYQE